MARRTMIEAVRDAMDVMMARDDNVVVFGEDVGYFGGVFRATHGLQAKYGTNRCFDTPISELGILGAAVGMAAYGFKPCVETRLRQVHRLERRHCAAPRRWRRRLDEKGQGKGRARVVPLP
jgi:pyruvate/2-oxoglutarate/acetoin dehydrogenase E1 component